MASAGVAQAGVDLAGHVTLPAAEDLLLGQALLGAPGDVGPGGRVRAHPGGHGPPQGLAGLPVTAAVEPPAGDLPRGGGDRRGPAQVRPGRLAAQPSRVVPGGDQQQRGGIRAGAVPGQQAGIRAVARGPVSPSRCPIWVSGNRARRPGSRNATRVA